MRNLLGLMALGAMLGLAAGCDIEIAGGYLGWPGDILYSYYDPGYTVVEEYYVEPVYYEEIYYDPWFYFP